MNEKLENEFWNNLKTGKKITLWIAKNSLLAKVICLILISATLIPAWIEEDDYWYMFFLACIVMNIVNIYVCSAYSRLMNIGTKSLLNGDPYPLLYITKRLLTFNLNRLEKQIVTINHAVALREVGEYESTYNVLKTVDVESKRSPLASKITYYNNIADICALLDKKDEFYFYFEKTMYYINSTNSDRIKQRFEKARLHLYAQKAMLEGQHDEAIRLADIHFSSQNRNACSDTDMALIRAMSLMSKGDTYGAKTYLESIVKYGGKLHVVTIAKNFLEKIGQ